VHLHWHTHLARGAVMAEKLERAEKVSRGKKKKAPAIEPGLKGWG